MDVFYKKLESRLKFIENLYNGKFTHESIQKKLKLYRENIDNLLNLRSFFTEFGILSYEIMESINSKLASISRSSKLSSNSIPINSSEVDFVTIAVYKSRKSFDSTYYICDTFIQEKGFVIKRRNLHETKPVTILRRHKPDTIHVKYRTNLFDEEIDKLENLLKKYYLYDRYEVEMESFKTYFRYVIVDEFIKGIRHRRIKEEPVINKVVGLDKVIDMKVYEFIDMLSEMDKELFVIFSYLYNHNLIHFTKSVPSKENLITSTIGCFFPNYSLIALSYGDAEWPQDLYEATVHELFHLFSSINTTYSHNPQNICELMFKFYSACIACEDILLKILGKDKIEEILNSNDFISIHDVEDVLPIIQTEPILDEMYNLFVDEVRRNLISLIKDRKIATIGTGIPGRKPSIEELTVQTKIVLVERDLLSGEIDNDDISQALYSMVDEIFTEGLTFTYLQHKFGNKVAKEYMDKVAIHYNPHNLPGYVITPNYFYSYRQILDRLVRKDEKYYFILSMYLV